MNAMAARFREQPLTEPRACNASPFPPAMSRMAAVPAAPARVEDSLRGKLTLAPETRRACASPALYMAQALEMQTAAEGT